MANTTIYCKGPDFAGTPDPLPTLRIDPIPGNISFPVGGTYDLGQYIINPQSVPITTTVTGLLGFASYSDATKLLTGEIAGQETDLQLEVTF